MGPFSQGAVCAPYVIRYNYTNLEFRIKTMTTIEKGINTGFAFWQMGFLGWEMADLVGSF